MRRPHFVPNFVPRSLIDYSREEAILRTLGRTGERNLRSVHVTLGHRCLSVAGTSLHVHGRIAGRRVVRERGVPPLPSAPALLARAEGF